MSFSFGLSNQISVYSGDCYLNNLFPRAESLNKFCVLAIQQNALYCIIILISPAKFSIRNEWCAGEANC
jgi:hypothetical protein